MTLHNFSTSVARTCVLQTQSASLWNLGRQSYWNWAGARHRVPYMQNMEFFYLVPSTPKHCRPMEARIPSLRTSLWVVPYHRQPSRGPVEASRLLSVSEASVCSVDMDEMSLIDDDRDGVALLLTAASVLRKPRRIKSDARHCCGSGQWSLGALPPTAGVAPGLTASVDKWWVSCPCPAFPGVLLWAQDPKHPPFLPRR